MKMIRCTVYNIEDPKDKTFFVGLNGTAYRGKTDVEIELPEEVVLVLEQAVVNGTAPVIGEDGKNKIENIHSPRFRVIRLGEVKAPKIAEEEEPKPKKRGPKPRGTLQVIQG